jgi:hypothetical protein
MNRTFINLVINLFAAGLFLAMALTGYVMWFPLPPETNKNLSLWGLTRHEWGAIHFWTGLSLILVILVHLAFHWNWIITVIYKQFQNASKTRPHLVRTAVLCSLGLVAGFGLFAWAANLSVTSLTGECRPAVDSSSIKETHSAGDDSKRLERDKWIEVYRLFDAKCLACHGNKRQLGNFRVDRQGDFSKVFHNKRLVVPGNSAESLLLELASGRSENAAFNAKHQLPEKDVLLLKAWIDAGAPGRIEPPSR